MLQNQIFNKVIIIGLGLIGGSIAKALRKINCCNIIAAYDSDSKQLTFAVNHGIVDQTYNFGDKIGEDDLVIIATPLANYQEIAEKISPALNKHSIILDIGSLKYFVEQDIVPIFGKNSQNFIPCHPIAGSEKSGVKNSDGELFLGKKVIITKSSITNSAVLDKVQLMWNELGCNVLFLSAKKHDHIFALVSHLPQFLSFIAKEKMVVDSQIMVRHTRLQNSKEKIWQDIFRINQENLNHYLKFYLENLQIIITQLEKGEYQQILAFLQKTFDFTANFALIYEVFPEENQQLILERMLIASCFVMLPDIADFRIFSGSGFRDFVIILSYLKYFLKNPESAIQILENSQGHLIKSFSDIISKINKYYEFN